MVGLFLIGFALGLSNSSEKSGGYNSALIDEKIKRMIEDDLLLYELILKKEK